jgi:predicted amidohydrolase YtcJ
MIHADKLYRNGKIYTMRTPGEMVESLVVYDGKIIFAGSNAEAEKYAAKETFDLHGATVLPGLIDTHMHLMVYCQAKNSIDLSQAANIDGIIKTMRRHADVGQGWLLGSDVLPSALEENRFPLRYELDRIATNRPILLYSHCRHIKMGNSKALETTGILKGEIPKSDERIGFYEDGEPNGLIMETAYGDYVATAVEGRILDPEFRKALLRQFLPDFPKYGLTTLHTFSGMPEDPPLEYFDQYYALEQSGELPVRMVINSSIDLPWSHRPTTGFGTDMVKLGSHKIILDGSMGGHTAALMSEYADMPGEKGFLIYSLDELKKIFRDSIEAGLEVSVHAIGDAAMETVLEAAEAYYPACDESDPLKRLGTGPRLRIVHAMILNERQITRIKRLPIILDVQPGFLHADVHIAEQRLGPERMKLFMPLKTFLDNGILMTGGSDAPVDSPNPLIGIQCAVTRKDLDGYPDGGLHPEECLSIYEAVALYTKHAAHCSNEAHLKGTLEAGKFADFILLDRDIFESDPNEIHKIRVIKTVLGGDVKWSE